MGLPYLPISQELYIHGVRYFGSLQRVPVGSFPFFFDLQKLLFRQGVGDGIVMADSIPFRSGIGSHISMGILRVFLEFEP